MKGIEKFEVGSKRINHKRGFWRKTNSFIDFTSMSMAFSVAEGTYKYERVFAKDFPTDKIHPCYSCVGIPFKTADGKIIAQMHYIPNAKRLALIRMIGKKIKLSDGLFCHSCTTKECKFVLGDLIEDE